MPARCLVRNLATLTQSASASKPRSSLLPSYSHSSTTSLTPRPTTALRPPYEHSLPSSAPSLSAPYKYTLLSNHEASNLDKLRNEHWNTWAGELIKTEEGRAQVIAIWTRSILELEKLKSTGARIPEVSFHSLASHLSSASTAEAISTIGSVIVRDVIPDAQAEQAARETLVEISQRGGQNVYWADALLGLRSDPSILSANNQLLRALSALPNGETVDPDSLILASGLQPGIENPGSRSTILSHPWAIDEKALHPATPLVAHLALTKATGQAFQLPASIHASIYATLRPLFRHKRSKISFYSTSAYLDPVNWEVVSHDSIPTWSPSEVPSFPHLLGASVEVPTLRPGDVLYRNAGIPVPYDQQSVQEQDQVFLPVTPLPRNQGNVEYTNKQREAFEKGVPPPHALQGEESLVSLELGGGKNRIGSAGGRSAMGY